MPDDEKVTEQVETPDVEDEEAMAAFDEEAGDEVDPDAEDELEPEETDTSDTDGETKDKDKPEGEEDGEPEKDAKPKDEKPKEGEEGEDDEEDPQKRLEKRLAEFDEEDPEKPPEPDKPAKPEDAEPPAKPAQTTATIEQVNALNKMITIDMLPDANVEIGQDEDGKPQKINLREFAETDPEAFTLAKVVSGIATGNMLRQLIQGGHLATGKGVEGTVGQVGQTITDLQTKLEDMEFDMAVADLGHPEFRKCRMGIDKDFMAWREKAPPRLVKLMTNLKTPEDAALVMENWKSTIAESKVNDVDDKARKDKAKKDALHKSTTRKKNTKGSGGDEITLEDEKAAFDEEAEKDTVI